MLTTARSRTLLACGWALILALWGCAAGERSAGEHTIRVMTYNIHHAAGTDGMATIGNIAKCIRESDADIVALQDVDRETNRVGLADELTMLADLTHMTYAFARSESIDGGENGNALLTRYAILEEKPVIFSVQSDKQQCSLMRLVLDVEGTNVVVLNTQLAGSATDTVQRANVSELAAYARGTESFPTLFCGSLSPSSDSSAFTLLGGIFRDCWEIAGAGFGATFPSSRPDRRIDFIYVLKSLVPTDTKSPEISLQPTGAEVIPDTSSDHRPLVVTVKIVSK